MKTLAIAALITVLTSGHTMASQSDALLYAPTIERPVVKKGNRLTWYLWRIGLAAGADFALTRLTMELGYTDEASPIAGKTAHQQIAVTVATTFFSAKFAQWLETQSPGSAKMYLYANLAGRGFAVSQHLRVLYRVWLTNPNAVEPILCKKHPPVVYEPIDSDLPSIFDTTSYPPDE